MGLVRRVAAVLFRALTVVFMLVVVLTAGYLGWEAIESRRLEAAVAKTRHFGPTSLPLSNPVFVALRTQCSDGQLRFILAVYPATDRGLHEALSIPDSEYAKAASQEQDQYRADAVKKRGGLPRPSGLGGFDQVFKEAKGFTVRLVDLDRFQMVQFSVEATQFTKIVGPDRKAESFVANGLAPCDRRAYRRVEDWTIQWPNP